MSSLRLFRLLHLRSFVRQPLRVALAVVAIAAGVAITVASGVLTTSIDRTMKDVRRDLAGPAPLRVLGPMSRGGLEPSVVEKLERVDGVGSVIPAIQAVTIAERADGDQRAILALGVDCRIEALVGMFGCNADTLRPARADAPLLISASLAEELGRGGEIRSNIGRIPIEGVLINDSLDETNGGRVVVFALQTAQRVFERNGRLDVAYVVPRDGVAATELRAPMQDAVGDWNTVIGSTELAGSEGLNGPLIPLLNLSGIFALGLSGLLVYNIVALTLAERRREIAVASATGTSPRAITLGALAESGLMGLVGGTIGALGGALLGRPLVRSASKIWLEQTDGIPLATHVSSRTLAIGVLLGLLTSVIAAVMPALRARKLDLAAELHGRATADESTRPRIVRRLALLAIGSVLALVLSDVARRGGGLESWQPTLSGVALLLTSVFVFGVAGTVAPLLLGAVLALLRRTGGAVRVGVANLVSQPRRTTVTATTVAAAVALGCVLGALIPSIRGTLGRSAGEAIDGRVLVSTLPLNNSAGIDAKPSREVIEKLRALPGVASLDRSLYAGIGDVEGYFGVSAQEGGGSASFERVAGETGPNAIARGDAVVGTSLARKRGLRPGSSLRLATPNGFREVNVAGIWASTNNNGNSVELSPGRFEEIFGSDLPGEVMLRPEEGVSAEELKRRVLAARLDPDLYALTPDEMVAQLSDEVAAQAGPFWALQRMMLFVALVGTLSTLLLVGVQRRRELGILGAVGFGPSALGRMTLTEGVATALAGSVVGVAGSLALFEALRNASATTVGARPPFAVDPVAAVVATALAVVVVVAGSALPAWRTSRLQIVEAIRDE